MPNLVIRFIATHLVIASHLCVSARRERKRSLKSVLMRKKAVSTKERRMISALLLLFSSPLSFDLAQVLIPLLKGTLPANGGIFSGRDQCYCLMLFYRTVALLKVISSIGANMLDLSFSLFSQIRQLMAIQLIFVRD